MSLIFYKFLWAKYRDQIIVNSGELPYAISAGNFPDVGDMKNIVRKLLKDAESFISIEALIEISSDDYEAMANRSMLLTS